ncbi:hypothetical protein roselon_03241 [Roseibacterium elongatum DSM 19469]|uniref:Uncharacterized protein n=1 Tax=Roseicyclus elongatus DSM 19469 TaxID=1294273 RepID=W8RWE6_9RHOB|nr:hypothetical protein roselon_03241 [Roseibacterium elongatum DSM 19469]
MWGRVDQWRSPARGTPIENDVFALGMPARSCRAFGGLVIHKP